MRKSSIGELHQHTAEMVREAADGEVIIIEREGKPVAELRPLTKMLGAKPLPDMEEIWRRLPAVPGDSGRFLEEDR